MTPHAKGLLITMFGVLFIVPDSLFVKLIVADGMVTAFWRGMSSGVFILLGLLAVQGLNGFSAVLKSGWPGWIYIILIGSTAPAFVLAINNTSVANVVFIFASMPVFAAIFGRIFLGEPISRRMVLTMLAVTVGLSIIAYGSGENAVASWKGDVIALYVSMAYAAALTAVRKVKDISMIPAIPIGYIGVALMLWPFIEPMQPVAAQWHLLAMHGGFIAIATCLLTIGPRYISSAEVSLLILLESVLAPILVWAVVGEDPGRWAIAGGAVVIGALLVSNLIVLMRRPRRIKATPTG
jgi:drug/metabolite transporter (DMT)-like permease